MTISHPDLHLPPSELFPIVRRLLRERAQDHSARTVLRCLARCLYELRRDGVHAGLIDAAEAMARTRLHHLASGRGSPPTRTGPPGRSEPVRRLSTKAASGKA